MPLSVVVAVLIVVVPEPFAPMVKPVAAPAKLTVVAVVLRRSKDVEAVVSDVVIAGDVPKTATPVPVSSVSVAKRADDAPLETRPLLPLVKTNCEAVRLERMTVPLVADPKLRAVVAPPAKLTVVAVVLTRLKAVEAVVSDVVIAGDVPKTATPVPVSSVRALRRAEEAPEPVKLDEASVKSALLAVTPVNWIVPEEIIPVAPETAPAELTSKALELMVSASPPSPKFMTPLAVKVPLAVNVPVEVKPEVAVIRPEMVGVAVQAVLPKTVVWPDLPRVRVVAVVPPIVRVPEALVSMLPLAANAIFPATSNF